MALDITFLGHATFMLTDGTHVCLVDPFLTGNPQASRSADSIERCDAIVLTHGHADHTADAFEIAKRTGATVCTAFELCDLLKAKGLEALEYANPGGTVRGAWGSVTFTPAFHSSSFEGQYAGQPMGAVVRMGGRSFFHLGDTALFSDLALVGARHQPDVCAVPVGDRFTMGPEDGASAAEMVGSPVAIPMHYATWPLLLDDISGFTPKGVEINALKPGQTLRLPDA